MEPIKSVSEADIIESKENVTNPTTPASQNSEDTPPNTNNDKSEENIVSVELQTNEEPSVPPNIGNETSTEIKKKQSVIERSYSLYQDIYESKQTQRIFLLSSIGAGLFDIVSDWSVVVTFYINEQYGWSVALTVFLLFHNVISLLYHISEHNEEKEQKKAKNLDAMKENYRQKSKSDASIAAMAKADENENQTPTSGKRVSKKFESGDWSKICAEIEYDETNQARWWHYPFFMIGLGAYAASIDLLRYFSFEKNILYPSNTLSQGKQNQVYMENRYFEVLLESMPLGLVTIFAQLSLKDYNWIVLFSIITSAVSVGWGTAIYFSRSHGCGNPVEFRPIMTSGYLWILLGLTTTLDYILRMYCPLLFIDAVTKWNAIDNHMVIAICTCFGTFLVFSEWIWVYFIWKDRNLVIGFGWLGLYSNSMPYFAAVITRFEHYSALWGETVFRNIVNLGCVIFAVLVNEDTEFGGRHALSEIELKWYVGTLSALFLLSNVAFIILVRDTKRELDEMNLKKSNSTFGRRALSAD